MNFPRLRELFAAWQDGSIREAELLELRDALPEVLNKASKWQRYCEAHAAETSGSSLNTQDDIAGRFGY